LLYLGLDSLISLYELRRLYRTEVEQIGKGGNFNSSLNHSICSPIRKLEDRPLRVNSPVLMILVKDEGKEVTSPVDPVIITFRQLQASNRTSPQCAAWQNGSSG